MGIWHLEFHLWPSGWVVKEVKKSETYWAFQLSLFRVGY